MLTKLSTSRLTDALRCCTLRRCHIVHRCWQPRLLGALSLKRLAASCVLHMPLSYIAVHEVPLLALEVMIQSASDKQLGFWRIRRRAVVGNPGFLLAPPKESRPKRCEAPEAITRSAKRPKLSQKARSALSRHKRREAPEAVTRGAKRLKLGNHPLLQISF